MWLLKAFSVFVFVFLPPHRWVCLLIIERLHENNALCQKCLVYLLTFLIHSISGNCKCFEREARHMLKPLCLSFYYLDWWPQHFFCFLSSLCWLCLGHAWILSLCHAWILSPQPGPGVGRCSLRKAVADHQFTSRSPLSGIPVSLSYHFSNSLIKSICLLYMFPKPSLLFTKFCTYFLKHSNMFIKFFFFTTLQRILYLCISPVVLFISYYISYWC